MEDVSTNFALEHIPGTFSLEPLVHVSMFLGLLALIAVSVIVLMDADTVFHSCASLICHCPFFYACLVLWPAEGHHCSTHVVLVRRRRAEGCCLSAEPGSTTGYLVYVYL
jgi:hypothetical protein